MLDKNDYSILRIDGKEYIFDKVLFRYVCLILTMVALIIVSRSEFSAAKNVYLNCSSLHNVSSFNVFNSTNLSMSGFESEGCAASECVNPYYHNNDVCGVYVPSNHSLCVNYPCVPVGFVYGSKSPSIIGWFELSVLVLFALVFLINHAIYNSKVFKKERV